MGRISGAGHAAALLATTAALPSSIMAQDATEASSLASADEGELAPSEDLANAQVGASAESALLSGNTTVGEAPPAVSVPSADAAESESLPVQVSADPAPIEATLPAFTSLKLMLNEELSSQTHAVGDKFTVTVLEEVVRNDTVVIPEGALGHGKVTFATAKGGFGKPGILAIKLTSLELGDREIDLDGRYREEGQNKNGAVFATWIAVGVFSGFIKGKPGYIEKGRELAAKTGEPLTYLIGIDAISETSLEQDEGNEAVEPEAIAKAEAPSSTPDPADGTAMPEDRVEKPGDEPVLDNNQTTLDGEY